MSCATSRTSSSICGRAPTTPLRAEDRKSTKTSPRRRPKRKTAASDTRAEHRRAQAQLRHDKNSTSRTGRNDPRVSAGGLRRKRLRARLTSSNERGSLQKMHEGTACGALDLLGVDRAIIVGIGSLEACLNEREKLVLVQSSVIIGVRGGEILGVDPATQFASVEGIVVIAVKLVEQLRGRILRFGEIDRAVVVRIEHF